MINLFERKRTTYKKNKIIEYGIFTRGSGKGRSTNCKSWTYWRGNKEYFFDGFATGRTYKTKLTIMEVKD